MPHSPAFASAAIRSRLLISILFFLLCSLPASAGDRDGCVVGQVLDHLGVPVAGISVRLVSTNTPWQSAAVTSDEKGQFDIAGAPTGTFKIYTQSEALGYVFSDLDFFGYPAPTVSIPAPGPCVRTTVNAGPPAAHLTLQGRDRATSEPIGDLVATVGRPGHTFSETWSIVLNASQRDLIIPSLMELDLELSAAGYKRTHFPLKGLDPGEVREFDFALEPVGLGCITGTAVDDAQSPVPGVRIELHPLAPGVWDKLPAAVSDQDGHFTVADIHPASFAIFSSKENGEYIYSWDTLDDDELPKVTVAASEDCQKLDLPLGPRAAQVLVKATDAETGNPVPKLDLAFLKANNVREGESLGGLVGTAHVPSLTPLLLTVSAPGYQKTRQISIAPLQPGQTWTVAVHLRREKTSQPSF